MMFLFFDGDGEADGDDNVPVDEELPQIAVASFPVDLVGALQQREGELLDGTAEHRGGDSSPVLREAGVEALEVGRWKALFLASGR